MKKLGFVFAVLLCLGVLVAGATAASLDSVGVLSDVYEYNQNDFPGISGGSRVLVFSRTYVSSEPVTVDSTPTGDTTSLRYPMSGWDIWLGVFTSPPIGSAWATNYTFRTDSKSVTLDLSSCTFRELDIPTGVSFVGNTISWDPVPNATRYRLRWLPWNNGLTPNTRAPLAETDYLTQPSYTMKNPVPGEYAIRIEAYEFCGDNPVNRSHLFVYQSITNEQIPTLSEWGIIILTILLSCSIAWTNFRQRRCGDGQAV